jgi:hypothetical protein
MDDTKTRERIHVTISPRAGQRVLRSRKPTVKVSDHEREAALGRERQDRWRGRQIDSKSCGVVEWSGPILTMLIETGYIEDSDAGDSKTVARAIGEMLADAAEAKAWRKRW